MGRIGDIRRANSRNAANELLDLMDTQRVQTLIQIGLGDWAEGPVLLERLGHADWAAIEPLDRYILAAYQAGFIGPVVRGVAWSTTGEVMEFGDDRTRTSIHKKTGRRGVQVQAMSYRLDDMLDFLGFHTHRAFLWMDCEGAEKWVLEGASNMLENVDYILAEMKADVSARPEWTDRDTLTAIIEDLGFEHLGDARMDRLFQRRK